MGQRNVRDAVLYRAVDELEGVTDRVRSSRNASEASADKRDRLLQPLLLQSQILDDELHARLLQVVVGRERCSCRSLRRDPRPSRSLPAAVVTAAAATDAPL